MGRAVAAGALRRLHRWAGLLLALPLILQGVSGCILAADPLFEPVATGDVALDAATIPAIVAAARSAAPAGLVVRRLQSMPATVTVELGEPGRQAAQTLVAIDPNTAAVLSVGAAGGSFHLWVHDLHENLLLGQPGRGLGGWCGVGLLLLGLSGIPLWWPSPGRWKAGLTVARPARGLRFYRQLHGAAGAWTLGLLLLQSVSGAALAFPQTARILVGAAPLGQSGPRGMAPLPPPDVVPILSAAIANATHAVPDATLLDIRLPSAAGRPAIAFLLPRGQWHGAPAAAVLLDPATGRVLSVQDPRAQGWGAWLLGWLRALHYGGGLGLGWRLVICAAGLLLPLFPVTGLTMWLLRRRNRRRSQAQRPNVLLTAGQ